MSDHAAFPEDLTRHAEALRRVALAVVRDEEIADDVVQSAYVKALERPDEAVGFGWLARAVRHRAVDFLRRSRTRREHEQAFARSAPLSDAGEIVERVEVLRVLSDAITQLPPNYQQVIYLRYMEGLAPTQIARRIGSPVKTVKTRLARALARMRELLEQRLGGREAMPALLLLPLGFPSPAAPVAVGVPVELLPQSLLLMSKKLVVACAVLVFLLGAYTLLRDSTGPALAVEAPTVLEGGEDADVATVPDLVTSGVVEGDRTQVAAAPESATDSPAAAPTGPGSLLVRVKRASGDPAVGVEVYVKRSAKADSWDGLARLRTDDAGEVHLEDVMPSTVQVGPLRDFWGNHQDVTILSGERVTAELTLADGIQVRGRVLDHLDRPVAGADIWVATGMQHWLGWEIVGRSDALGGFELEGIDPGTGLGAIASGHERSPVLDLDRVVKESGAATVELRLGVGGGKVTGRVLDPDGGPVEGAWVALGKPIRYFDYHGIGDGRVEQWTPAVTRTGEDGAFVFHGLPLETHPLEVRAEGYALWKSDVELTGPSSEPVIARLARGFSVAGTVRDGEGQAVVGAVVRAYDTEIDRSFVQGGQFDYYSAFGFGKTETDEEGRYRIDHLQLVPIHVWATPPSRPREFGGAVMRDHAVVEGNEGEVVPWDATLTEGLVIHGQVTYSDGEPMEQVFVSARHDDSGTSYTNVTDPKGVFRFTNMEAGAHSLGVQMWNPPEGAAPIEAAGVFPSPDLVLLAADFPKPVKQLPGAVIGRLVDDGGRLEDISQLRMILRWKKSFTWNQNVELDGMRFAFHDIDPGEYRVCAFSGDTQICQGEWFELLAAETKDLGDLRTVPGGSVLITVDRSALPDDARPTYTMGRKDAIDQDKIAVGSAMSVTLENLEPGVHVLTARGDGLARVKKEIEVLAGEVVPVNLVLLPAVRRDFSIEWGAGEKLGHLHTWLHGKDGTAYWDLREKNVGALPRPYERWTRLPIGEFVLKAETGSGLKGSVEFSVTDLQEAQETVELMLR